MADVDIATELAVLPGSSVNVRIRIRSKPVGGDQWPHRFAAVSPSAKNRNPPIDATPIRVTGANSRVTDGVWSDTSPPTSADYSNRSGRRQTNRLDTGFRTGRVPTGHQLFLSRDGREWRTPPTQVTASDQQALGYKGAVSSKRQARFVSEQALRRPALRHISRGDEILDRRDFIAPVRNKTAAEERTMVRISPQISAAISRAGPRTGTRFTCCRNRTDSNGCTRSGWIPPLIPRRAFYPFNHFHKARLSTGNIEYGQMEIGVAADNIVFSLGYFTGNLRTLTK